jgi:hypothetical protein
MFLANKLNKGTGAPPDAQFNYVTMLLHGDGTNGAQNNTFLDSSTNNFTITRNGNTTQGSFSPYGPNWSNYFNGSSTIVTPTNTALSFGTGDFSVEAWINYTAGNAIISNYTQLASPGDYGTLIEWNGGSIKGTLKADNSTVLTLTSSTSATVGSWNHVAFVRTGTTVSLYLNGVRVATGTSSINSVTNQFRVGGPYVNNTTADFTGYVSNLRVCKGTTPYLASATSITVSTQPLTAVSGTSLLTCADNRFIDDSTNNFAITAVGTPSVQRFNPFGTATAYSTSVIGGSGYFDGASTTYLSAGTGTATAFDFGTGDFTIECWAYVTAQVGSFTMLASTTSGTTQYWGFGSLGSGGMTMYAGTSGTDIYSGSANTPALNQWNHLVWQRGSGTASMYLNGTRVYNAAYTANFGTTADGFRIGNSDSYANYYTNGYISNFRVVKGSAVYSGATITVPTAPLTAVTNTQLLLGFTNGAIFDNAMMNDLQTVGNAQISTSVKKYGTGSLAFDGSGDWLTAPANLGFVFGSGNFTIEAWVNPSTGSGIRAIVGPWTVNSAEQWLLYLDGAALTFSWQPHSNMGPLVAGGTVSTNVWTHVAVVRNGNTFTLYVNGTSVGSATSATTLTNSSNLLNVGCYFNGLNGVYTGYIDDIRITKGFARYTATFTAPTAAFPNTGPT